MVTAAIEMEEVLLDDAGARRLSQLATSMTGITVRLDAGAAFGTVVSAWAFIVQAVHHRDRQAVGEAVGDELLTR